MTDKPFSVREFHLKHVVYRIGYLKIHPSEVVLVYLTAPMAIAPSELACLTIVETPLGAPKEKKSFSH